MVIVSLMAVVYIIRCLSRGLACGAELMKEF